MSITVVATLTPLPEHRDAVRAALLDAVPKVHAEDGCELYALHENADGFVFVEQWSGKESLAVHSKAAAVREMGAAISGLTTGPATVVVLEQLPAGDPVKGRLAAATR